MKSKFTRYLNDLKKHFSDDGDVLNALKTIREKVEELVDEKTQSSQGGFEVPVEIAGDNNALAVFSDGGCRGNPGPGAYGVIVQNSVGEIIYEDKSFYNPTTNNKMELQGAIEGLHFVSDNYPDIGKVFLYTDSKYVVDGMKTWVDGWKRRGWKKADKKAPENLELWQTLDELRNQLPEVHFLWVKGHAGHPQNEYCDQLANMAMDENS